MEMFMRLSGSHFATSRKRCWAWTLVLPIGFGLAGCGHTPNARAIPAAIRSVKVVRIRSACPQFLTPLPGELRPYQDVRIKARVEGFVKRLYVDRGSWVRRGQTLARLSAPELRARATAARQQVEVARAQYLAAQAAVARDQATLQRLQASARLVPGSIAGNDLQVARQTVAVDRAQAAARRAAEHGAAAELRSLAALTGYLRVAAPFTGMIVQRFISTGSLVGPSATAPPLFRLQQLNPLRLVVEVPETDAVGIRPGGSLKFSVAAFPGRLFSGVVARIPDSLHQAARVMPVELNVANRRGLLAPGMYAQVRWRIMRRYPTLLVPASAVASTTKETFVNRIMNGRVEWVPVRRGFTIGKNVEIFGRLRAGERVAVRGTDELRPGTTVRAVQRPPLAAGPAPTRRAGNHAPNH